VKKVSACRDLFCPGVVSAQGTPGDHVVGENLLTAETSPYPRLMQHKYRFFPASRGQRFPTGSGCRVFRAPPVGRFADRSTLRVDVAWRPRVLTLLAGRNLPKIGQPQ
jgi:hypothetical protein